MTVRVVVTEHVERKSVFRFLFPFVLGSIVLLFFIFFADASTQLKYAQMALLYYTPMIGVSIAIPIGLEILKIHPVALVCFLLFLDCELSIFVVLNFDMAKILPYIGAVFERMESSGRRAMEKYKWVKRFGFIGLVSFVMIPCPWTGSGVGSVIGRMMGFPSFVTFIAVFTGSLLRLVLITLVSLGILHILL
ncbi:MAG: small multi-drug export protein [Canidatus Methanoxibalbensis ujae]|nr:small multi-drug export protein [Candidatus Methanoxibalbensis ujae]MCW7078810.1 small multi-drug export protein [Candidatus Methanoxibalbensis ujae]